MGRRDEEADAGRRYGRHRASPSPTRGENNEEAIRNKLRESGWKKRRTESDSTVDADSSKDQENTKERMDKGSPRSDDARRASRSSRRSRSPRRRGREHRSSRRKSSGSRRRSMSRSRSPASRSRSRSTGRRRRRHSSSSRKRHSSRSPSRTRDSKRSRRSTKSSRRSRSPSPQSPSRSSRRRRHRRSYSRSRSPSRSRRVRRGGSRVNPTITQLMAQYPTMSLQDIIAKMQASNVTMAAAVAQKPARELYVGNLPPNVTGPQLQEFLSTIIQQVGLTTQPGNPIINTWTSTDGHFAFCEMRSVEECNLALLLNQLSLLGQPLKFGRPRSFMGPPQPMPQVSARTQTALTNLGCTPNPAWFAQHTVSSTETTTTETTLAEATLSAIAAAQPAGSEAVSSGNRLIMSNIPVVLAEEQVKELVEPFGKLKSFTLVKDSATGASLGSALFEYEDSDVAAQAVEGLNGLSIGGILLSVQRQPASSAAALPSAAAANPEDQPSAVLKMANMVSIDELRDDEEYADLAEDVEEECKRFGGVTGMEIPRPKDGEEVPGLGCIYVRFGKEEDAVSALKALNGRKFGGNIVKVTYFPVDKFEKNELF
ncbi:splicing factor U2af large subunit, putative [Phytophthora infestans T30-4]|uniref:Splicing factor U2af large subunit, putative n=1 Tax=Phytophthora infestans (strain T30-4) TaxID=403677 RepID=D0MUA2_PHYIT|nr:splicing factor U2af large subunit, putative [Phytophthora infestans T30-4]EEY61549.1 splicing factor U2af large subunit, putative [Phytophthora infestans T30-4]|eukprot:XP_002908466.1 splicing factor U2af large subunit, putative [Phytophthora infestans T30-4]